MLIIKDAIDLEPSYLATFLVSPKSKLFQSLFSDAKLIDDIANSNKPSEVFDQILLPLCKFCYSICITSEGRNYLMSSKIIEFVLDSIISPSILLPKCFGYSLEKLTKIGRLLSQIMQDCDQIKFLIKLHLKEKLLHLCQDAKNVFDSLPLGYDSEYSSRRMQVLQKLTNIITVIEGMFTENRRHYTEMMREILNDTAIETMISGAFQCTMPPSRQLFAQLSIKNSNNFPNFGHSASSKAITSLLKLIISSIPQLVLPILYKEIDRVLGQISAYKQLLRSSSKGSNINSNDDNLEKTISSGDHRRRRSRGSSLGSQMGSDVLIIGVLDCIPDKTVIDAELYQEIEKNHNELEANTYKFLCSILTIEWLSMMLSHALRNIQRHAGSTAVISNKDVLRRLFAFHRSSMLEVCRLGSKKLVPKV